MSSEELEKGELYWRDNYSWFFQHGYQLRPRYDPDWTPSWKVNKKLFFASQEDYQPLARYKLNDATRVSDGKHVILKRISREECPTEVPISTYFSRKDIADDPDNHCIPVLDTLNHPEDTRDDILVLPMFREYDSPEFDTIGEAVEFVRQILKGFAFLHKHRVAHRDVRVENVLMDPTSLQFSKFHLTDPNKSFDYTTRVRPKYTRTERPPKYYIIDFGFSKQYSPEEMPPSEPPRPASDDTLPELKDMRKPCNPLFSDVYYVGNMIRMDFIDGHPTDDCRNGRQGFEFLRPLVDAMIKEKPEERITMQEAVAQFDELIKTLGVWKLRSRVIPITGGGVFKPNPFEYIEILSNHWSKKLKYAVLQVPPVPVQETVAKKDAKATKDAEGQDGQGIIDGGEAQNDVGTALEDPSVPRQSGLVTEGTSNIGAQITAERVIS